MISSRDLRAILRELGYLRGSFIDNLYGEGETYALKLRTPGRGTEMIAIDFSLPTFHATSIRLKFPKMPSGKILNLRKHLKARIEYASQESNERIVRISLSNGIDLIVELFGGGNIILVKDSKILLALRYREYSARKIKPNEEYRLPPAPKSLTPDFSLERGLVRDLVRLYGVPPKYAREIAYRAGIEEKRRELTPKEKELVYEIYNELLEAIDASDSGYIYSSTPSPIELLHLGSPDREFESFNEAVDFLYARIYEERLRREAEKAYAEAREKIYKILEAQRRGLERLRKRLEEKERLYERLSMHAYTVEELLEAIRRARKRLSREEIEDKLREAAERGVEAAKIFRKISPREAKLIVYLDGVEIPLDIRKSVFEILSEVAEEIKKTRQKIESVSKILEEKSKELEEIDAKILEASKVSIERRKKRKKLRYERFRRIKLENSLIVGGKDAKTNEILIRRRMQKDDLVFHADYYGSPFVLLKGEKSEEAIREAALLTAAFSRARKDGLNYVSVFYVSPEQISLGAPHGQYVSRGAFVIRGKRNYLDVTMRRAIGESLRGSPERVKSLSKRYIVLAPGGSKKEFIEARKIALDLTGLDRVVPSNSRIVERKIT